MNKAAFLHFWPKFCRSVLRSTLKIHQIWQKFAKKNEKNYIQLYSTVNDVICLGPVMYSMSDIVCERHVQLHGKTSKRVRQAMAWSYRRLADRECDNRET